MEFSIDVYIGFNMRPVAFLLCLPQYKHCEWSLGLPTYLALWKLLAYGRLVRLVYCVECGSPARMKSSTYFQLLLTNDLLCCISEGCKEEWCRAQTKGKNFMILFPLIGQ